MEVLLGPGRGHSIGTNSTEILRRKNNGLCIKGAAFTECLLMVVKTI